MTDATGDYTHTYSYALLSIDDLWSRRTDIGDGHTFGSWGALDGDTYQTDAAKLPWAWDDPDDGPTFTGDFIADPAHLIDTHLNGLGTFSHEYVYHPYYTHRLSVSSVTSLADRDPFGNGSDIYVKMIASGVAHSDDRLWKKNDASVNTSYSVTWGTMDAGFAGQYSSSYSSRYVAVPPNSTVTIEINDSDGTSGDENGFTDRFTFRRSNGELDERADVERPSPCDGDSGSGPLTLYFLKGDSADEEVVVWRFRRFAGADTGVVRLRTGIAKVRLRRTEFAVGFPGAVRAAEVQ
ncbi:MAG: hypothetical protein BLM47_05955 [Candidatus Reconcilbacillus cellulovorans]|uniref:Uncharacterized protein n=1 Tax=Candidatus Reconcilbacillus cellulovorans TaxID=1906605 RepID=A0A2A6E1F4_9BACL|nr:MAG: hypothetical protein BLM47_05955 [Candidatus Reconcilbacillus cellulovorans]